MSFISYAQNFEDVMLWRALRHIENGCYVDIGAQDPVADSVSRAFYEQGWRGIHIEPVPAYAERLRRNRPDEIVLQAALGEMEGTLELNIFPDTGLSTAVPAHAQRHHDAGREVQKTLVPLLTMKNALSMVAGRDVHWLKIDVEGFEEQVLKGWDSSVLRPWVMLIEATVPGSTQTDYQSWEPTVLRAGYRFVYFDGLNRFYVAQEHAELEAAFNAPPNVFDDVQLSGLSSWGLYRHVEINQQALAQRALEDVAERQEEDKAVAFTDRNLLAAERDAAIAERNAVVAERDAMRVQRNLAREQYEHVTDQLAVLAEQAGKLLNENNGANFRIAEAQAQIHEWWSVADRLSAEVHAMHASTSWRITAPLRHLRAFLPRLRSLPGASIRVVGKRIRGLVRGGAVWAMEKVLASPRLRTRALRLLAHNPALRQRLRQLASREGLIVSAVLTDLNSKSDGDVSLHAPDVPRRTAVIYKQLKKQSD